MSSIGGNFMKHKTALLSILFSFIFASTVFAGTFKLPDTGQTKCYQGVSPYAEIPCGGTGQDGEYIINPMSYTDNGNGTVTDNNTGLVWQQQDDDITYNWYQATGTYHATYNPNTVNVCGDLGPGWRLPTKKELLGIVDYSVAYQGPVVNASYFLNTNSAGYWSGTEYATNTAEAWSIAFNGGVANRYDKLRTFYVRCVVGDELRFNDFEDNGDDTVTDHSTGLMWQKYEASGKTWADALAYCKDEDIGGFTDWRLPNIKELESLTDDTDSSSPVIDTYYFPNGTLYNCWSSTTQVYYPNAGWGVQFGYGIVSDSFGKDISMHARCVRGGPVFADTFKLPDTGQAKCYQGVSPFAEIPCAGTGQDGEYTINSMSYTDNGNGTVTDNNTGLVWQQQDDGNTYNWYQATGTYHTSYNPNTIDVCSSLGEGWRLPSSQELGSLINYGVADPGPAINAIFTNTQNLSYWSSTPSGSSNAWNVHFRVGGSLIYSKATATYVRCVKGAYPVSDFVDNGNNTITDKASGLMWQKGEGISKTWASALSYCEGLTLGELSDWRVPTPKELETLVDYSLNNPAIDTNYFTCTCSNYWSSTTHATHLASAWTVNFRDGGIGTGGKDVSLCARCVRGGQGGPPPPIEGNLNVSPLSHNFGNLSVETCSGIPQEFTLSNTGNAVLNVSDIALSDTSNFVLTLNGGTNPCNVNNPNIAPGSSCTVTVAFCPSTSGTFNANLTIVSNDPNDATKEIPITGVGEVLNQPIALNILQPPIQDRQRIGDKDLKYQFLKFVKTELLNGLAEGNRLPDDQCYLGVVDAITAYQAQALLEEMLLNLAVDIATAPLSVITTGSVLGDIFLKLGVHAISEAIKETPPDESVLKYVTEQTAGYILGKAVGEFYNGVYIGPLVDKVVHEILIDEKIINWEGKANNATTDSYQRQYVPYADVALQVYYSQYTHYTTAIINASCGDGGNIKKTYFILYELEKQKWSNIGIVDSSVKVFAHSY